MVATDVVDDRGQYRVPNLSPGDYLLSATLTSPVPLQLAPTYYPGTNTSALALPITLGVAEERNGVNVQINAATLSTLNGTVTSADGKPAPNVKIAAVEVASALGGIMFRNTYSTANGSFRIENLAPGRYRVTAWDARSTTSSPRSAVEELTADGNPIREISLILREGERVSGKIAVQGAAPLIQVPLVTLRPLDRDPSLSASFSGAPDAEGSFSFAGVIPGRYLLVISNLPAGYLATGVYLNGRDLCDLPIEVRPSQEIRGLEIRVSPQAASLAGTVLDSDGQLHSDVLVVVFPADEKYWVPDSPRIRTARPASDGKYFVRSLPPGPYRLAVVADAQAGEWFVPAFLERLGPVSIPITLSGGESRALDVKVK